MSNADDISEIRSAVSRARSYCCFHATRGASAGRCPTAPSAPLKMTWRAGILGRVSSAKMAKRLKIFLPRGIYLTNKALKYIMVKAKVKAELWFPKKLGITFVI